MGYTVHLHHQAEKDLHTLPPAAQTRINTTLRTLATTPRPPGVQKLSKRTDCWRIRTGNHRVIYQINDKQQTIQVNRICHRKNAYRGL